MLKPMLRALLLGLLSLAACEARAALPGDYKVVLLTENFPPFNSAQDGRSFGQDGGIDGISTEIVREMFRRAGIAYTLSLRSPWEHIYQLTQKRPGYALFSTIYTAERAPLFKWVGPLASTQWVILAPPSSHIALNSLKDIAGYRVGAYRDDAVSQSLQRQGLAVINVQRDEENVQKLMAGELDLWATSDPVGPWLARRVGVTGLRTLLRFHEAQLYLALNKDTPDEIVVRLQQALDAMRAEGFLDKANAHYR
ncbi:MAG: hypothetical protein GAK45_01850 [Pseudomonas citronellolis]|nr:MAG: hypothetical protein GAK45_01850 [Pseudomonas citronellolis]